MNTRTRELEMMLRTRGALTAVDMARALGVSRPTVSRILSRISARNLVRIGRARASSYALRRQVRHYGSQWPLYSILPSGDSAVVGQLCSIEPNEWYLEQDAPWASLRGNDFTTGIYPGFPWFLHDLRPQGFLGRIFARTHAGTLGAPTDPRVWGADDILGALLRYGDDLPGSFVIGDEMLADVRRRMQSAPASIAASDRTSIYPRMAGDILTHQLPGSSAAGEQPKFTACIRDSATEFRHVIVKFSGRSEREEDRRWSDLLIAEDVANHVLASCGIRCAETSVIRAEDRTFLESTRFDRIGEHGRVGLVSLEAFDSAFIGDITNPWIRAADLLQADGCISREDADNLGVLWWFGNMIGNTDMHYGNVSLHIDADRPLTLAPVYDMVPMAYRPGPEGLLPDQVLDFSPPPPTDMDAWHRASAAANEFWGRLSSAPFLSSGFMAIAKQNAGAISTCIQRYA